MSAFRGQRLHLKDSGTGPSLRLCLTLSGVCRGGGGRSELWVTHGSLGQRRDDVAQRWQRFIDVLRLVQHCSLCTRLTDLDGRSRVERDTERNSETDGERERERERESLFYIGLGGLTFSLPARSTRYSFPLSFFSVSTFSCLMLMRKILWLRELCSFMSATHIHTCQVTHTDWLTRFVCVYVCVCVDVCVCVYVCVSVCLSVCLCVRKFSFSN